VREAKGEPRFPLAAFGGIHLTLPWAPWPRDVAALPGHETQHVVISRVRWIPPSRITSRSLHALRRLSSLRPCKLSAVGTWRSKSHQRTRTPSLERLAETLEARSEPAND
jgi:hypothetical protein